MWRFQTLRMRRAFFAHGATQVWNIWYTSMAELARQYQMTVVAGSALMPDNRWPYHTNQYRPRDSRIYNLSMTIDPQGRIIYYTRKVNLVPTQEDQLDLTPGPLSDALALVNLPGTEIPLATAICYDGFCRPHTDREPHFVNVLEALDRRGAKIVAQPSANPWWWDEPWPLERSGQNRVRSVQWDQEGSLRTLQQCQNVEVIVNPQLQLELLDLHFDGQSRIMARRGSQVEILNASEFTHGPEADTVLHAAWDFSTTPLRD
jgi:predicted amidohydrolase